jgi:thioredoxin-like negative regulator of GroEL
MMPARLLLILSLGLASGCAATKSATRAAKAPGAFVTIEDNFRAARVASSRRNVPLIIEAWAPWCHTCRSLREVVMRDPQIVKLADVVQFASIDVDRKENEEFLERFPVRSLPTIFILEPESDVPSVKWLGALTVAEFTDLIHSHRRKGVRQEGDPFAAGDAASAVGDNPRAVREYRSALASLAKGSPAEARVVDSLVSRLSEMGAHRECLQVALERHPTLWAGTSRANVVTGGLQCALEVAGEFEDSGNELLLPLEREALALARDVNVNLLADDRSALFEAVIDSMKTRKAAVEERHAIAREWSAFLDESARIALGKAATVFESHRTLAHLELGEFDKATKILEASIQADPSDYNPHARLAAVHLAAGRLDMGLLAIDRALALAYGPRKLRMFKTKIELLQKKGDRNAEREAIDAGLAHAKTVRLSPNYERLLSTWQHRRRQL